MSYRDYIGDAPDGYSMQFYPTSRMLLDIRAIQQLYGANMSTRTGNDTYSWAPGQRILETIWDAGGEDTISWANQSTNAVIRLGSGEWSELGPPYQWSEDGGGSYPGTLAIAEFVQIENAVGGRGNDRIVGNGLDNSLDGLAGNDTIYSGVGFRDTLWGREGNDILYGEVHSSTVLAPGLGNDTVYGDFGDMATFFDATAAVTVSLVTNRATGGVGTDTLISNGRHGISNLAGSAFNDTLIGDDVNNSLLGSSGNDTLIGGGSEDTLFGGNGNDVLQGGRSGDRLRGDRGADRFDFNAVEDSDSSSFRGADTILDFNRAEGDKIDLSTIMPGQAFSFVGRINFSSLTEPAQVGYMVSGNFVVVCVSTVDRSIDMQIGISGITSLAANDFIL